MHLVTEQRLNEYLRADPIGRWLALNSADTDGDLTCQRWLLETPGKRYAAHVLYGDLLLDGAPRRRILDVGGGLTSLTRELARRHDYVLCDVMAHDPAARVADFISSCPPMRVVTDDWMRADGLSGPFDLVIAADLFPNVDQRLAMFVERHLPRTKEMRLSLTYYPEQRFYVTKRIGADEQLTMLAWDGEQTARALHRFGPLVVSPDFSVFESAGRPVYPNGRQVVLAALQAQQVPTMPL